MRSRSNPRYVHGRSGATVKSPDQLHVSCWRRLNVERFNAETAKALRQVLAGVAILTEPSWRKAIAGDSTAAIGLALRLPPERTNAKIYDLVMTALAICGAEGSAAACLIMAHVLERMPGRSRRKENLVTAWLARCLDLAGQSGRGTK